MQTPRVLLRSDGVTATTASTRAETRTRHTPRLVYPIAAALLLLAVVLAALRVGEHAGRLSDWQALVLGVTQGLTELLPVSSSGHLILVPWLAHWHYLENHVDFNKTFDVALHLGTLLAVAAYFWDDVVRYVGAWFASVGQRAVRTVDQRLAWILFAATIPAAIAGAAGEERAQVERDVEGLVEVRVRFEVAPVGEPGHEDQVAGGRDR